MSSNDIGVHAIIKKDSPKALCVHCSSHCSSHCSNLVTAESCKVTEMRNMLEKLTKVYLLFR